jgi:hypothetical protein
VSVIGIAGVGGVDANALAQAEAANAEATAQLQAAISANTDFAAQLEDNDIAVSSVVSADVAADGSLVLYTSG